MPHTAEDKGRTMYTDNNDVGVALPKSLWCGEPVVCPKCGRKRLVPLHKNAKRATVTGNAPAAAR